VQQPSLGPSLEIGTGPHVQAAVVRSGVGAAIGLGVGATVGSGTGHSSEWEKQLVTKSWTGKS
jgi:hypothetical protein